MHRMQNVRAWAVVSKPANHITVTSALSWSIVKGLPVAGSMIFNRCAQMVWAGGDDFSILKTCTENSRVS